MNLMEVNNEKRDAEKRSELEHDWTELTWECLIDIFSRLSMKQRWIAIMLVCKTWMNVCKDPMLNLVFDIESWFKSSSETRSWETSEFAEKVDRMLMSVVELSEGRLKEIRVRYCTDKSLLYVADRCPNLEVLWVKHSQVTVKSMAKIALKCVKIIEVDISHSYKIPSECMQMLGRNCKNLQILKRNFIPPFEVSRFVFCQNVLENQFTFPLDDHDAYLIGENMHQLKHLEIRYSLITELGFAFLSKKCPNLEYVDVFGCRHLRSEGVTKYVSRLKNLKEIKKP